MVDLSRPEKKSRPVFLLLISLMVASVWYIGDPKPKHMIFLFHLNGPLNSKTTHKILLRRFSKSTICLKVTVIEMYWFLLSTEYRLFNWIKYLTNYSLINGNNDIENVVESNLSTTLSLSTLFYLFPGKRLKNLSHFVALICHW